MIEFFCGFGIGCCLTILFCHWAISSDKNNKDDEDKFSSGFQDW
jgi:hypothetical protein